MEEVWKDIDGYEGLYQVSNLGRVKGLKRTVTGGIRGSFTLSEKVKSQMVSNWGYMRVHLSKDGIAKKMLVHRLVARAFIPNPDNLPEVNHKDGDKRNNAAENLEWVTQSQNEQHKYNVLKYKPKNMKRVMRSDGQTYESVKQAALSVGKSNSSGISLACHGKIKSAYGYGWKFCVD